MTNRKYTVSGTDWNGDHHSFSTNDEARARAMESQFKEDLDEVTFEEAH